MLVIPAIDLLAGKVVRLAEGKRESATVYHDDPPAQAMAFLEQGAKRLHVVDLDGAFSGGDGDAHNRTTIAAICTAVAGKLEVQVGGGVRDLATCDALLAAGAKRVVLGTAAIRDAAFLAAACGKYPGRVIVAVDAKEGKVAISGWTEATEFTPMDIASRAVQAGAAGVLYTDIKRDGMRTGPNVDDTAAMAAALSPLPVIASGGISSLDDLRALHARRVPQCVIGRALYESCFTLPEAINAAR